MRSSRRTTSVLLALVAASLLGATICSADGARSSEQGRPGDERPAWSSDGRWISFYRAAPSRYAVTRRSGGRVRAVAGPVTWPPTGHRMAVERSPGTNVAEISIVAPEGSAPIELGAGTTPAWSPDGDRVVFSRDGELFVADANGSAVEQLPIEPTPCNGCETRETDPGWSPNGRRLVFVHEQTPPGTRVGLNVMVAELDGTGLHSLRRSSDDLSPQWSPDGRRIAFLEQRFPDGEEHVWIARTSDGRVSELARGSEFWWSPRSDRIAYRADGRARGFGGVRIVGLRDSRSVRLSGATSFAWAPDGRRFAYSRAGSVYVAALGSPRAVRVGAGAWPAWSPDGRLVAYAGPGCGASGGIHVVEPDGTGRRRLTRPCR